MVFYFLEDGSLFASSHFSSSPFLWSPVPLAGRVRSICCGHEHVAIVTRDGALFTCGSGRSALQICIQLFVVSLSSYFVQYASSFARTRIVAGSWVTEISTLWTSHVRVEWRRSRRSECSTQRLADGIRCAAQVLINTKLRLEPLMNYAIRIHAVGPLCLTALCQCKLETESVFSGRRRRCVFVRLERKRAARRPLRPLSGLRE